MICQELRRGVLQSGLRTPAPVRAAPPSWGRHPQTFTKTEVAALRRDVCFTPGERTSSGCLGLSENGMDRPCSCPAAISCAGAPNALDVAWVNFRKSAAPSVSYALQSGTDVVSWTGLIQGERRLPASFSFTIVATSMSQHLNCSVNCQFPSGLVWQHPILINNGR